MAQMKKPVVKLTKKAYGEAVNKAFNANQAASKKKTSTSKPTFAKMPAVKIIGAKPGVKKNLPKIEGTKPGVKKPMPKILGPIKPIRVTTPKPTPTKKKVLVMPNKISPSKMTPAQKARYLKNPERYDG